MPTTTAAAHVGGADPAGLLDLHAWRRLWTPDRWREALCQRQDEDERRTIRLRTHTGRPLGSDRFIAKLEAKLGRRLRPLPVGRPKKAKRSRRAVSRRRQQVAKQAANIGDRPRFFPVFPAVVSECVVTYSTSPASSYVQVNRREPQLIVIN